MSVNEEIISNLCTSCGYCCDGTLFNNAKAYLPEDKEVIEQLGLTPVHKDGKDFFKFPCCHFDQKCTVYDSPRPKTCGIFFCEPLKELKKDLRAAESIEQLIGKVKILRRQMLEVVEKKYPELSGLTMRELRAKLSSADSSEQLLLQKKYPHLHIIGIRLFPLLKEFYNKKKE
jgi:hypothetical protein